MLVKSNSYIGDYFLDLNELDSAYYYYYHAEKECFDVKNKELTGKIFFKKALVLFFEGNYLESEIQASKALQLIKSTKDKKLLFSANNLLGLNFERLEEFDEALKYYKLSRSILNNINASDISLDEKNNYLVTTIINLSNVYVKIEKYNDAINELKSVDLNQLKQKWPNDYVAVISNLAYAMMKSGKLKGVEKLFMKALILSNSNNNKTAILYQELNLGEYYLIINKRNNSILHLKNSIAIAKKIKAEYEIKTALRFLVKVDPSNSTYYDEQYISISDSLTKLQQKSRDKFARIEYETSLVKDENKTLTMRSFYIIICSALLILILTASLILRYLKSKKRELLHIEQQKKAEEEIFELLKEYQIKLSKAKEIEQNRISKELHDGVMNKLYGVRMQLGILNKSDEEEIKNKRLIHIDALQDIEKELRTISHDLNTDLIEGSFDYISLLTNLILEKNEIGGTNFKFNYKSNVDWETVSSLIKIAIYRIVQEALSNVLKYAEAQNCNVNISIDKKGNIRLIIKDDGKGFDLNNNILGIGLKNMKERATNLNASFQINSSIEKGTKIKINFSL
ncbi:ATP-binding protein [Flavobacterium sp. SUN046]|uniref:tetratricopeptide repeat-containing sensor histidine kinase n=1 Tax=Flavobacterium sp. SUN046 TaxID=3002440 RepID=UPI002DBAB431|nr:ATP-binding protein [Flavobacterium sp. SUN046]MEC4048836.1 ATP-binding protein [Flavobacterium sp. SUN046]